MLQQRDACRAVRVVLQAPHLRRVPLQLPLKVHKSIQPLCATAAMPGGNPAPLVVEISTYP